MGTRSIVSTNEPQISPDDEPVPVKVVFASMVGVWLCYFLLITLLMLIMLVTGPISCSYR